jgi:hypothetical protein
MKQSFDNEAATPFAPSPQKKYEKPEIEVIVLEGKATPLLAGSYSGNARFQGIEEEDI